MTSIIAALVTLQYKQPSNISDHADEVLVRPTLHKSIHLTRQTGSCSGLIGHWPATMHLTKQLALLQFFNSLNLHGVIVGSENQMYMWQPLHLVHEYSAYTW